MKLFKCSNGTLINPDCVARCRLSPDKGVSFYLKGPYQENVYFDDPVKAKEELKRFYEHVKYF